MNNTQEINNYQFVSTFVRLIDFLYDRLPSDNRLPLEMQYKRLYQTIQNRETPLVCCL